MDLGDLDGDYNRDIGVSSGFDDPAESVWLIDGSGNFSPHPGGSGFGAGDSLKLPLTLGDLETDGDLDGLVANFKLDGLAVDGNQQPLAVWLSENRDSNNP